MKHLKVILFTKLTFFLFKIILRAENTFILIFQKNYYKKQKNLKMHSNAFTHIWSTFFREINCVFPLYGKKVLTDVCTMNEFQFAKGGYSFFKSF